MAPMRGRAGVVVTAVEELYGRLVAVGDLRPGPEVDGIFTRLVGLVLSTPAELATTVLADPAVRRLRPHLVELSARAEYELERAWAERIVAAPDPHAELARFPYVDNYRRLARLEQDLVVGRARPAARRAGRPVRRVLFVGSGPLPLSSLFLAAGLGVAVDNLDRDPTAVDAARRVAAALGAGNVRFAPADVLDVADLSAYDLVVLAALVGVDPGDPGEKRRCLVHLGRTMAPGALVLARSAHALRTLLYPAVDLPAGPAIEALGVVHPRPPVINSLVLGRVAHAG